MAELTFQVLVELMRFTSLYCHPLCNSSPTSACRKKTGRMPVVAGRLRDPDINPCLLVSQIAFNCREYRVGKTGFF